MNAVTAPHAASIDALVRGLETDPKRGLSDAEAASRLAAYGPNALPSAKRPSLTALFLRQFHNALMYILLGAGVISVLAGETRDALGVGIAILLKAVIGFFQERRAEAAIERLRSMVVQEATVIRDGRQHRVPASAVVQGDLLALEEGGRIVADARLVDVADLSTTESVLTGESGAVRKSVAAVAADALLPDRADMVWMGTTVAAGTGRAIVVETGLRTAFGQIAASLHEIKRGRTPLETQLDRLGRWLGIAALLLAGAVFAIGVARGFGYVEMFFFAVATVVAVVPEGLPAVLAVVMAIGVQRMAKRNAIVRHVPSVETLGATDVICTDKTGTLTENKMTVRELSFLGETVSVSGEGWEPRGEFTSGGQELRPGALPESDRMLVAAALASGAELEMRNERYAIVGDPTEGALTVVAAKAGIEKTALGREYIQRDEIPFSSLRKYRAVLVERTDLHGARTRMLCVAGAYGVLREQCAAAADGAGNVPFDTRVLAHFNDANHAMAGRALRVLAIATKEMPADAVSVSESDIQGLTLVGLVGMSDPPRAGVARALERCRQAGIRVIMLTGDQRITATAIGQEIGLLSPDRAEEPGTVYTEKEVASMDDAAFSRALQSAVIFARVTPQTKLRIVDGLLHAGKTVAMTGDGVNDAPALKKASIGVAMGISGTDVTQEVADMVLADDNFVTIVNAAEEGRIVFRNVSQTTAYLFMTNIGEAVTILAAIAVGLPLPLLPAQILWMNLVTDGFPDMSLASEPAGGDMLKGPPRAKNQPIISRPVFSLTLLTAALMCSGTLLLFEWALARGDLAYARTVAFTALAMFQLWNVFNLRSLTRSLFSLGLSSNPFVLMAVGLSVALQCAVLYIPMLQQVFETRPLGIVEWGLIIAVSSSVFVMGELWKLLMRRYGRHAV